MQTSEELLQSIGTEVTHLTEDAQKKFGELSNRLLALEQKADASKFGAISTGSTNDVGRTVIESAQFKSFVTNGLRSTGKISVGDIKTSLINAIGQNQPLVAADRTAIVPPVTRRLTIRDVLPSAPTSSNSIEFPKETSFTNNAAPQYSAAAYENVVKAESAMTFSLTPMPVSTVAHWIPVSNQLLDDAPAIQGYVNNRLLYGLNLKIETELETDGRWIADAIEMNGVMRYGETREEAIRNCKHLAEVVFLEKLGAIERSNVTDRQISYRSK